MEGRSKGNLLLLLAAAIWGFAFVAQREGMVHLGPLAFNGIRFLLGALTVLVFVMLTQPFTELKQVLSGKLLLIHGLMAGLVLFFASSFQQLGMIYTTAGNAGFITSLYVLFVPVIGLMRNQPSGKSVWAGALLAAFGLYLLSVKDGFAMQTGDLLVLISAVFWAFHLVILAYIAPLHDFRHIAFFQFLVTGTISLLLASLFEDIGFEAFKQAWLPILYTGILSAGLGFTLQIAGQRKARADHAALILSLEAVFALAGGYLILHESMTPKQLAGAAFMLAASVIAQWPAGKNETKKLPK